MVKSGIPVPETIPDESRAFVLCVPDTPEMMGIVMGAIKVLTFGYYWQGTEEQIDAVTARFNRMYMDYQEQVGCMICDMVAECFTDGNEALIEALAEAIRNNSLLQIAIADALASQGGATPGLPLTPGQSAGNILPENIKDEFGNCVDDNLWGAMLYLVQSGNRIITDFFEVLEVASNTLESMEIISQAIPAAGNYISAAAGFADQLGEVIAEGYAGAYTEGYEQQLACALFCLARTSCDLSLDAIVSLLNSRLSAPMDIGDFGEIMAGIASGEWVGDELADVAFMCFFGALKFGQQFADTLGVRPLPVLMSLGADQLASNNWEVLCACGAAWAIPLDLLTSDGGLYIPDDFPPFDAGLWVNGVGWTSQDVSGSQILTVAYLLPQTLDSTLEGVKLDFELTGVSGGNSSVYIGLFPGNNLPTTAGNYVDEDVALVQTLADGDIEVIIRLDRIAGNSTLTAVTFYGSGIDPTS